MPEQRRYDALVRSWLGERTPADREALIATLEAGVNALWRRAQMSIEDRPLRNLVGEILLDAAARFPALAPVRLNGGSGILVTDLLQRARPEDTQQLREGTSYVMAQFLAAAARLTRDDIAGALDQAATSAGSPG